MNSSRYPALRHLFGAYFHQDFDLEYKDAEDAINGFLSLEPQQEIEASVVELHDLLKLGLSESDLERLLIRLGLAYDATSTGLTNSEWLEHVKQRLETRSNWNRNS
ncbi:contact-dependent growth inhibition system immunity protein [Noviherbaspirillum aridicola]|uniref:CdiI immunity protein domain-containing protein n=1 Tax=Noviherbaspirillum aridicola TaxID=2849687 RepID=A0ABQ4Q6A7_9BURK|nr:hypothetical protein NCCP691_23540 [Noviherbaspirillum aridicola]